MVQIAFYLRDYGRVMHITPRFIQADFLSRGTRLRSLSFMSCNAVKAAPRVELQSLKHGVKVEVDAEAKQDPEECEPTPSKKRMQTRQRSKDSIPVKGT